MTESRKIAFILAADRSRLAGADEDRTLSRLRGLRSDLIDPAIASSRGRVVERTAGRGAPAARKSGLGVFTLRRLAGLLLALSFAARAGGAEYYGYDQGGGRFAPLDQITPGNVDRLISAWTYHTGDLKSRAPDVLKRSKFEVTPILVGDKLVACTPFNAVVALDPGGGRELWRYDPEIKTDYRPANMFACRGVAVWHGPAGAGPCSQRILTATADRRLIALDLKDGKRCADFGQDGAVRIDPGKPLLWPGEFQFTSPPAVIGDLVILGSSIADNARVDAPRGTVRAFDVRTGALRWAWDPVPERADDPDAASWGDGWRTTGAANVWAPIAIDEARGLIFLPTTSPSPDFYGGLRPGDNRRADSVVALKADTGALAWSFQLVHHDVWDYDNPAQPSLATITLDGKERDVVIQGTKQGLIFVLDRDTGKPVLPVKERPVPQGGVDGEALSPTQPFPADLPPLGPDRITPDEAWGLTPWDRGACAKAIASARSEGRFTPPGLEGALVMPFTGGGVNWGGLAVDAGKGVVYVNSSNLVHRVTLFPAADYAEMKQRFPDKEVSPQRGAPFGMKRELLASPLGLPCNPPPWGVLTALDLGSRKILWQVPLGTTEELNPLGLARHIGTPTFGGPLATASGLIFIGAALDDYLRAFDARTGAELWTGRLPSAGIATPTSYLWQGRQYVVIAAGGHGEAGAPAGDTLIAFALPRPGESGPSPWLGWLDRPGGRFRLHAGMAGAAALALAALALAALWLRWRQRRHRRAA
jgi:quinoprotein glucose dehydrogenase